MNAEPCYCIRCMGKLPTPCVYQPTPNRVPIVPTVAPELQAIMAFVEAMCYLTAAEATGYYSASVLEPKRAEAKDAFVSAMNKIAQDGGN